MIQEYDYEVGETRQASIWYETDEQFQKAQIMLIELFETEQSEQSVVYGPIQFQILQPTSQMPKPPNERCKLLLAEALVTHRLTTTEIDTAAFHRAFDDSDIKKMRQMTLIQYRKNFPGAPDLSIKNIDQILADEWMRSVVQKSFNHEH